MPSLEDEIVKLKNTVAELERRVRGMIRHGPVKEIDDKNHRVRIRYNPEEGEDNKEPYLSGWIPYTQLAGLYKDHVVPAMDQNMTVFSPNGDHGQSLAVPMTWSDKYPSPSQSKDERVIDWGKTRLTFTDKSFTMKVGNSTIHMTEDKITHTTPEQETSTQRTIDNHSEYHDVIGPELTLDQMDGLTRQAGKMHFVDERRGKTFPLVLTTDGPIKKPPRHGKVG